MIKKIEGKMMSGEDTGIWPFFKFLKRNAVGFFPLPQDFECSTLLKFVFELEYYTRAASIQRRQIPWKQART